MFNAIKKAVMFVAGAVIVGAALYFGLKALAWLVGAMIIVGFVMSPLSWFSKLKPTFNTVGIRLVGEIVAIGLLMLCGFPQFVTFAVFIAIVNAGIGALRAAGHIASGTDGASNATLNTGDDNVVPFRNVSMSNHNPSNPEHFNKPATE